MSTYHVQTRLILDMVQSTEDDGERVQIAPRVLRAKWTKNDHRHADQLLVTVGYRECGVEPRLLIDARCAFWLWDDATEAFDQEAYRFVGICKKARRKMGQEFLIELEFDDYTSLFLDAHPGPAAVPEWTDTLATAWQKLCDNTGWMDPAEGKVKSSVAGLRDTIVFEPPELGNRILGETVPPRLHAITKPSPKADSDAWGIWLGCVESLGLMTYIDRDRCIVTTVDDHYDLDRAPQFYWGGRHANIAEVEEDVDTKVVRKGVCLRSFDALGGRLIEAFYPPPGDARIKTKRSAAGKKSEGGTSITANEVSGQYDYYDYHAITEVGALYEKAKSAYEQRRRQSLHGRLRTHDLFARKPGAERVSLLSMRPGNGIGVRLDDAVVESLMQFGTEPERIDYLVNVAGYAQSLAELIAANAKNAELLHPYFHVSSVAVDYADGKFEIDLSFHNVIFTK